MPKSLSPTELPEVCSTSHETQPTTDELEFYDAESHGEESRLLDPNQGGPPDQNQHPPAPPQTWVGLFLSYWRNPQEGNEEEEYQETYGEPFTAANAAYESYVDETQRRGILHWTPDDVYEENQVRFLEESEGEENQDTHSEPFTAAEAEHESFPDEIQREGTSHEKSDEEYEFSEVEFLDENEDESCKGYVWKFREYPSGGGKTKPGEAARPRKVWKITRISQRKKHQISPSHEDSQQREVPPTTQPNIATTTKVSTSSLHSRTPLMPRSKRPLSAHDGEDDDDNDNIFQESHMAKRISKMRSRTREIRSAPASVNAHGSFIPRPKRRHSDIDEGDEAYLADDEQGRLAKRSKTENNSERAPSEEIPSRADYGILGSASPAQNSSKNETTNSIQGTTATANAIKIESVNPMLKRKKNSAWSDREHDAIYQFLRAQRQHEMDNPTVKKLRDEKLFNAVSNQLKEMGIDRSPNAAKNYWNRYGRARSGFDERIGAKINRSLTTSAQGMRAQARKTQERET